MGSYMITAQTGGRGVRRVGMGENSPGTRTGIDRGEWEERERGGGVWETVTPRYHYCTRISRRYLKQFEYI